MLKYKYRATTYRPSGLSVSFQSSVDTSRSIVLYNLDDNKIWPKNTKQLLVFIFRCSVITDVILL